MSTEELQLVLTMVEQAGEGAFALACIYLTVGFLKATLSPAVWLVFFILAYRGGRYAFDKHCNTRISRIEARTIAQLDWVKIQYPSLTKDAAEQFVKGRTNDIKP